MNKAAKIASAAVAVLFLCWLAFIHHTEAYHLGVRWNLVTGEVSADEKGGYHITPPWVLVSRIDTRPMRVCVTTSGRGFNCRLIQFIPAHYQVFAATEGFRYWWWSNRISFNFGYSEEYRGMKDLLRGYAYGTKQYPFVETLKEFREGE